MKNFIIKSTLIFLLSFQVNAVTLHPDEEEQLGKELEKQALIFIEDCIGSSESEDAYHLCILSNFRKLVEGGNTLAAISIIEYLLNLKREKEAYEWYNYTLNSNLSKESKLAIKFQYRALAEKFQGNNP